MIKNLPAMQETQNRFLGGEGPLEKGMATHSGILAWTSPWTGEPGGVQSMGLQRVGHNSATKTHKSESTQKNSLFKIEARQRYIPGEKVCVADPEHPFSSPPTSEEENTSPKSFI